ncbi:hypothetical protein [Muriicola sp.]
MQGNTQQSGLLTIESNNEIYKICDVQITQTEFIISVMAPTVLQLI